MRAHTSTTRKLHKALYIIFTYTDGNILASIVASFGQAFAYKSSNSTPRHRILVVKRRVKTSSNIIYNMYVYVFSTVN